MIRAVNTVAAMDSYALADLGEPGAVSLAQNESTFPPSPHALSAARTAMNGNELYPDPDWRELCTAIRETHPVDRAQILCGAGSMELIGCIIRAYSGPGDTVLGTQYGYLFVATAAQQAGSEYVRAPEPDLSVSVDAILSRVSPSTRIVFVCNPGNPTGTRIPNAEIVRMRESLSSDILLVVDQAYAEFDDQDHAPIFILVARGDTVVTRTLSKAYGLAGARVGWGVFPEHVSTEVRKLLNPNNIPLLSQCMASAALRDRAYMLDVVRKTSERREEISERLRQAGYVVPESATNFLLIRFPSAEAATTAEETLRSQGLILRRMAGYGLPDCLRATVGPADAMDRMAKTLEALK